MRAIVSGERAAEIQRAVQLRQDGINRAVGAGAAIKSGVQRAIAVKARNAAISTAVDRLEFATGNNLPIDLPAQRLHRRVRPEAGVEARVQ